MAGIYGSSAEDRYRERQLDAWLDSQGRDEDDEEFEQECNRADEYNDRNRFED